MNTQAQPVPTEGKENKTQQPDRHKVTIPCWLIQEANRKNVTGTQLIVYSWLYNHNRRDRDGNVLVFARPSKDSFYNLIKSELGYGRPDVILTKLVRRGWIRWVPAKAFKGVKMYGWLCLLDSTQRQMAHIGEQTELQPLEEEVITVESSVSVPQTDPDDGMFHHSGLHWYEDADGNRHYVPEAEAYRRPSPDYIWDPEGVRWCLPNEETDHELEF